QAAQHLRHLLDNGIEIGLLESDHLTTAEGQQLAGRRGSALGVLHNLRDLLELWLGRIKLLEEYLAVPADDGQQIIEIVSYSAGVLAPGLPFLRLTELVFEEKTIRDIAQRYHDARDGGLVKK